MLIFIYSRKSVYTGKGESIENQIDMCRQYIQTHIASLCDCEIHIYEDEGFSGKNLNRPQFTKMLHDSSTKKPNYIICYRLDRISRSVCDFSALIEKLNKLNISFICIKEQFDTSNPMGRAMMYISSVFAQLERETIAERVRDNMIMLAHSGRWLGGTPPTGFTAEKRQKVLTDGKLKITCQLKLHPNEAKTIALIYEKFLEFRSISSVSHYLIKNDIRSRTGKYFSLPGIRSILQNPVYCIADAEAFHFFRMHNADISFSEQDCSDIYGLLSYNKRDYKKKSAPRLPIEQWIISIGGHHGIIPGQEWVHIQNALQNIQTHTQAASITHNDYALLSGRIQCGQCGSKMYAKFRSHGAGQYDYICGQKMKNGTTLCSCQNLNGPAADALICEHIAKHMQSISNTEKMLNILKKELQKKSASEASFCLHKQIAQKNTEIQNLIHALALTKHTASSAQHIDNKISILEQEIASLQKQYTSSLQAHITKFILPQSNLAEAFACFTMVEKREILNCLLEKIIWDGLDLHIFI